jgi:predicted RNA-binding Zn-ribbon protein involved in translation (DUF1610 family)
LAVFVNTLCIRLQENTIDFLEVSTPFIQEAEAQNEGLFQKMKIGDLCPECGEAAVVNEEGCRKCYCLWIQ